jgi:hypothetical protein
LCPRLERCEDRKLLASYTAAGVSDLIKDINTANRAGGSNTIMLAANTTFDLTKVNCNTDGPTGLPVIATSDSLTINGQGGDIIERDSSASAFRLFDVASGATLELNALTLQNGLAFGSNVSSQGGAIYNHGSLDLRGVTVQNNIAQGSNGTRGSTSTPGHDALGGGVWSNGSLTAENGTQILNNHAIGGKGVIPPGGCTGCGIGPSNGGSVWGAGIYVAGGTADLTGITVSNNLALAGPGQYSGNASGGGLYIAGSTVNLSNDTVDDNQAAANFEHSALLGVTQSDGGGLCVAGGTVNLSGDTVDGNMAGGKPGLILYSRASRFSLGGGIYVAAGTVTLHNDAVENNVATAYYGGWGAGIGIASTGTVVYIDAVTVSDVVNNTSYPGTTDNIDGPYTLT